MHASIRSLQGLSLYSLYKCAINLRLDFLGQRTLSLGTRTSRTKGDIVRLSEGDSFDSTFFKRTAHFPNFV
jgi:hypothetical protein